MQIVIDTAVNKWRKHLTHVCVYVVGQNLLIFTVNCCKWTRWINC